MNTYAVIDFETTGLSPEHGARPTEIAVVLVRKGRIVKSYQSLMDPGVPIPHEIQSLTGITNQMIRKAPDVATVMSAAAEFAGDHPLVAHNASFDRKFWDAELQRIRRRRHQAFVCSLLLSRRLFPQFPNHKLQTLVRSLRLPDTGRSHRALADAEATAHLLLRLQQELVRRFRLPAVDCGLLLEIQQACRGRLEICVRDHKGSRK